MMYAVLPDLDSALVLFIQQHSALTALHGGRVGTRLAAGDASAVRVSSLGGTQPWPWEVGQEHQIEWWGPTAVNTGQPAANLLARTGEAALYDLKDRPVTGGRIVGVSIALSMLWSPDDVTGRARYITHVQLTASPEA